MRIALLVVLVVASACQREPSKLDILGSGAEVGDRAHDCSEVVARIQAAVQSQIDKVGSDAKVMIDKMLPEMRTACVEDHWPDTLVRCVIATKPGDLQALEHCNSLMPKDLQDKLQQRMLRTQGAQAPQQP